MNSSNIASKATSTVDTVDAEWSRPSLFDVRPVPLRFRCITALSDVNFSFPRCQISGLTGWRPRIRKPGLTGNICKKMHSVGISTC